MANPPNQPDVQTVAGATEFDGTSGALGFVNFGAYLPSGSRSDARAKVLTVSFNATGGAALQLDIFLAATLASPTTERIILVSEASITTKTLACGIIVPKVSTTALSWGLFCITNGKTAAASLVVDWVMLQVT